MFHLACHLQNDADPDPGYHFDANPDADTTFKFHADPDLDSQHCLLPPKRDRE